jgi:hypothetical protein
VRSLRKIGRNPHNTSLRATDGLSLNLSELQQLGEQWSSPNMIEVYNNLVEPTNDANTGKIVGNRNFYSNDYMVSGEH